jgi:hypothetical protein
MLALAPEHQTMGASISSGGGRLHSEHLGSPGFTKWFAQTSFVPRGAQRLMGIPEYMDTNTSFTKLFIWLPKPWCGLGKRMDARNGVAQV